MTHAGVPLALAALFAMAIAPGRAAAATRVTFVVSAPAGTPAGDLLWLSGDRVELGGWNGAGLSLVRAADGTWRGTLELPVGTALEYKVTRGDWNRVEKDAHGGEIANRTWTVAGDDTVRIEVQAWRDQTEKPSAPRPSTINGDVRRHPHVASAFVAPRDVLVWLPPGYDAQPKRRYPVLYFLDGQNVFDGATSFIPGQEWGADEAANAGVRGGAMPPCILVAIANTSARADEYTFARDAQHGGGLAARHQRFVLEELKPMVDSLYRTKPDAAHTGVVGSSLGGLAALDFLLVHPAHVGMAGCVSPAVWWADREIVARVRAGKGHAGRVWLDIGTAESVARAPDARPWVDDAHALHEALVARGWRDGADLHYEEIEGAKHNEAAWAARVGRIMAFLLTGEAGR